MDNKQYMFACYHTNDEDTTYDFIRLIVITDRFPTICDGWDYRYIGQVKNNDTKTTLDDVNKMLSQLDIDCDFNSFKYA